MTVVDDPTVILQLDQPIEEPRFFDSLDLVAISSAVECAGMFVSSTVRKWKAGFIEHQAVTIVRELAGQAVTATGYTGDDWYHQEKHRFITVRVFGFKERIGLEVWDRSADLLPATEPLSDETPSGLQMVDMLTSKWGSSPAPNGRVMWAELPVYEVTAAGLPLRARKPTPYPRTSTTTTTNHDDLDFLGRIRDGLYRL